MAEDFAILDKMSLPRNRDSTYEEGMKIEPDGVYEAAPFPNHTYNNESRRETSFIESPSERRQPVPVPPRERQQALQSTMGEGGNFTKPNEPGNLSQITTKKRLIVAVFGLFLAILVFVTFVLTIVLLTRQGLQRHDVQETVETVSQPVNDSNAVSTGKKQSKSCQDLMAEGLKKSGVFQVSTDIDGYRIEVFCDMETDGGGWTLVASIHEDNIYEKCDGYDRWSTRALPGFLTKTNWENKMTFGNVNKSTIDDYKSEAYYELKASDVMIWHVPSGATIDNLKKNSTLRYRTNDQFLLGNGRNLYGLFNDRYPLAKINRDDLTIQKRRSRRVVDAIFTKCNEVKVAIPNWQEYIYNYNTHEIKISDTTLYMPGGGNQITFFSSVTDTKLIDYEKEYEIVPNHSILNSRKSQPFFMAVVISNEDLLSSSFKTRVLSNFRTSAYSEGLLQNKLNRSNFEIQYTAVHFYHNSYPAICEYHFVVFNRMEWGSKPPSSFQRYLNIRSSNRISNDVTAHGTPTNFVMGYMLLTRTAGNQFTTKVTDAVSNVILDAFMPLSDLFNRDLLQDGLAVPITFDKGDSTTVLNMIPPIYRPFVDPGYIQFRAFNMSGYGNAICPGIRVKTFHPEYVCIGGYSDDLRYKYGTCGDFAGWGGKAGEIQENVAYGSAHARSDISSSILIFYR